MTDIASGRVIFLQEKIKELIETYEEYIGRMVFKSGSLTVIGLNEYNEAREKIEQLKKELE